MMITHEMVHPDARVTGRVIHTGLSFADYLREFEGVHAEWLTGQVLIVTNNVRHQQLLAFLTALLHLYLGFRQVGELLVAGVSMYLSDQQPAREPDLMVVLREHQDRIRPTYLNGAADVVFEIVSPESSERDYGTKYVEYEAAGVTEYWLLDPLRQQAALHRMTGEGYFQRVEPDAGGRLVSTVLSGFALQPEILWQEPLPAGQALIELVMGMVE